MGDKGLKCCNNIIINAMLISKEFVYLGININHINNNNCESKCPSEEIYPVKLINPSLYILNKDHPTEMKGCCRNSPDFFSNANHKLNTHCLC